MNVASLVELKPNLNIPALTSGDTVKVSSRVVEGDKERIQVFQGVVIKVRNRGAGSSFTVRRVTYGVGVERTFPFYSPRVEKVEIVRRGKTRRAKLYYLRGRSAKTSRLKERRLSPQELEREKEEARRLKEQQELEREQAKAQQLESEEEQIVEPEEVPAAELEEEPVAEQEEVTVAEESEEVPAVELEEEPVAESEEVSETEQVEVVESEQEPVAEREPEESPSLEKETEEKPDSEQEKQD